MAKIPLRIVRDTREQKRCGWMFERDVFQPKPEVFIGSLPTCDYSLLGHEDFVGVERKTLPDLVACLGVERERFERELQRMKAMEAACVIVEASQAKLRNGEYRSQLLPGAAWQTIVSFSGKYRVPFLWGDTPDDAEKIAYDFLRHYANHFWSRARALSADAVKGAAK